LVAVLVDIQKGSVQIIIHICSSSHATPNRDITLFYQDWGRTPFKDSLLQIVEERGGITQLAEKTGIPQPSLSRFFNSSSMPHRVTLLKIAKALNLDAIPVSTPWEK